MTITKEQIEAARKAAPVHLGPALDSTIEAVLVAGGVAELQAENKRLREALTEAEPYVETLHSLVGSKDVRAQVWAVVKKIRAALKGGEA